MPSIFTFKIKNEPIRMPRRRKHMVRASDRHIVTSPPPASTKYPGSMVQVVSDYLTRVRCQCNWLTSVTCGQDSYTNYIWYLSIWLLSTNIHYFIDFINCVGCEFSRTAGWSPETMMSGAPNSIVIERNVAGNNSNQLIPITINTGIPLEPTRREGWKLTSHEFCRVKKQRL